MTKYDSSETEKEAVKTVAMLMAAAARTAPKTKGLDSIKTLVLDGDDLEKLAIGMEKKAEHMPPHLSYILKADMNTVKMSSCVLLVGVTGEPKRPERPFDCGACGYDSCNDFIRVTKRTKDFTGPVCMFQIMDLGIALGSAVKIAGELNIDNRMMYSIGVAAKEMQLMDSDVIIGIPLSTTGKNIYFDRK